VGVITNVGAAHLEGLGSLDGVARAKGELYARMRPTATAVANAADTRVAALAASFPGRVIRFGDGGEVTAADVRCDDAGAAAFELRVPGGGTRVQLPIAGRHNVDNALAAAAACYALGIGIDAIRRGLERVVPVGNRMRRITLPNGVTIVNDSYNANPASVAAGLRSLKDTAARRRIAVLGDMLELGPASAALHRDVGRLAAELGIDALWVCGDHARDVADGARSTMPADAVHVADSHAAIAAELAAAVRDGDWVLVKGSRGQRMEEVVRLLGVAD
jgi:UDP-N-acetylmuramoyl-tripeptide--D-alanyl-D-alanine ligase